jgi:hypothetical protein
VAVAMATGAIAVVIVAGLLRVVRVGAAAAGLVASASCLGRMWFGNDEGQ